MSIYDTLNEQQKDAVLHTEGPVLILAGAGSGKTRVLTHRIAYLIEKKGVNPWNIMAITFTNKAAGEMRERVDKLVGFGSESIWVSTFHSSCVRILRRYIDRLGYDTNFVIYDADDQKSVMKDVCKRLCVDTKTYKEKALLAAISKAKDELIGPEQYELDHRGDMNGERIAAIYKEYQKVLRHNNAVDFDDLICLTVELFKNHPDVLEGYQERLRYIMVDEYQDTNTAQFMLVSLLASKYKNLCVVGDDDQSIYKFRGANIANILNFEHVFPGAYTVKLEQNYRSTQNILNVANAVIKNNQSRKVKSLWTDNPEGTPIKLRQFTTGYEEADYVVRNIEKRISTGEFHYKDCAILYRTNAQSRMFEEKLLMASIPYRIIGGVNFYARKEIKDLLAYLKTVDNARDDLAVRRIINVPKRGIGATTLNRVQEYAGEHGISFYEALKGASEIPSLGRSYMKVEPFVTFIQTLKSKAEHVSVKELLEEIIEETGYMRELRAEATDEALSRLENIDELISKVAAYEENTENPTLSGFLADVALVADIDSMDDSDDHVTLMTLHSAKGLEFPNVYMAGMEDGIFPSYMTVSSEDPSDLEEERRLCYVGITRAMKQLTLTCARQRMARGEIQYNRMSRFIKEIPDEYLSIGQPAKPKTEVNQPTKRKMAYQDAKNAFKSKALDPKQFKVEKAGSLDYTVGDSVKHIKFGVGIVEAITDGGRDFEVTVNFDKYGVKKMFAGFAKLKKI